MAMLQGARRASASAVLALAVCTALAGCSFLQRTSDQGLPMPSAVASGTPGASASVTLAAGPTPAPVTGYTLTGAPGTVLRQFQSVAVSYHDVFAGITVRTVSKGRTQVGTVVLLGLRPALVGNKTVESRLGPGMVKGMSGKGAKVSMQKIAGRDVAVATTASTSIVSWYTTGTLVLVLGTSSDPAAPLAYAKAYLAGAAPAP